MSEDASGTRARRSKARVSEAEGRFGQVGLSHYSTGGYELTASKYSPPLEKGQESPYPASRGLFFRLVRAAIFPTPGAVSSVDFAVEFLIGDVGVGELAPQFAFCRFRHGGGPVPIPSLSRHLPTRW